MTVDYSSVRRVLPVGNLTSDPLSSNMVGSHVGLCGGAVVPTCDLRWLRKRFPTATLVVPGVRLPNETMHDHNPNFGLTTPGMAVQFGADYVVVGRPITGAADPVAAARAYIEDMS
jgi:orotidine-5'-phosphate decarboxylase